MNPDPEANGFQSLIRSFFDHRYVFDKIFVKIRSVVFTKVANRQTNKQTNKQTNAGHYITSLTEVIKQFHREHKLRNAVNRTPPPCESNRPQRCSLR